MKITDIIYYDGARERITKLGLSTLYLELLDILLDTKVFLLEEKDANGGAAVRKLIDQSFEQKEN